MLQYLVLELVGVKTVTKPSETIMSKRPRVDGSAAPYRGLYHRGHCIVLDRPWTVPCREIGPIAHWIPSHGPCQDILVSDR